MEGYRRTCLRNHIVIFTSFLLLLLQIHLVLSHLFNNNTDSLQKFQQKNHQTLFSLSTQSVSFVGLKVGQGFWRSSLSYRQKTKYSSGICILILTFRHCRVSSSIRSPSVHRGECNIIALKMCAINTNGFFMEKEICAMVVNGFENIYAIQ